MARILLNKNNLFYNLVNLIAILVWEFWIYKEWLSDTWKERIRKELNKKK